MWNSKPCTIGQEKHAQVTDTESRSNALIVSPHLFLVKYVNQGIAAS